MARNGGSGTILFLGLVAGAGALFATKPDIPRIEDLVARQIEGQILTSNASGDLLSCVALVACRANIDDCVQLVRAGLGVTIEDYVLLQHVTIGAGNSALTCVALLDRLYCPTFLNQNEEA